MITLTGAAHRQRAWRVAALGPLVLLAACASARITGFATGGAPTARPEPIVVAVSAPASSDRKVQAAAAELEMRLVADMRKLGLSATSDFTPEGVGIAHLDLRIVDYQPGNDAARMLIGFGAGKSAMTVTAALTVSRGSGFTLDARSHGSTKPGLILPGGVAAVTGEVLHLAIGGTVRVATSLLDRSGGDAGRISRAVSRKVAEFYGMSPP